jgi:hypothetical protein
VWAAGEDDAFAVGDSGTIIRYDGSKWGVMDSGTSEVLTEVWGTSNTDVYAVGFSGTILHYDGDTWTVLPVMNASDQYTDIWGSAGDDIYVVGLLWERTWYGGQGIILHFDGTSWSREPAGTQKSLTGVWGDGAGNVFAVGEGGTILKRVEK